MTGRLTTYWEQNSNVKDFISTTEFLLNNLIDRGYSAERLQPIFVTAAKLIDEKTNGNKNLTISSSTDTKNDIYFHIPFHPKDVSRQKIQQLYNTHCVLGKNGFENLATKNGSYMKVKKLTVAYSRPRNLRDCLVQSKLIETEEANVGDEIYTINFAKIQSTKSRR